MEEHVELHEIKSHVNNESEYEIPTASRNEENEYTRIGSMAETSGNPSTTGKTSNADKVHVSRTETDIAALKKVYIFCGVLLAILVTLVVIIGVLTYTLVSHQYLL